MDIGEIIVKVFNIGHGIYDAERTRKRAAQRSSELKELSEKIAPEIGKTGIITQQAEKTEPAASEGLLGAKDQGPPEPTNALSPNIPQEKLSEEIPRDIATACVPCAVGHLSACAGLLNEAVRFKKEGLTSNQVMDDIGKCIMELNALERVDLTPEKIQTTKGWEKPIAKEALQQSRNLRHRLEKAESMEELEEIAADTQRYYTQLNRQWYKGRFRNLDKGKQEAIASRVSNEN